MAVFQLGIGMNCFMLGVSLSIVLRWQEYGDFTVRMNLRIIPEVLSVLVLVFLQKSRNRFKFIN